MKLKSGWLGNLQFWYYKKRGWMNDYGIWYKK